MMAIFAIDNFAHTSYTSSYNSSIVFSIVSPEASQAVFIDRITIWDRETFFPKVRSAFAILTSAASPLRKSHQPQACLGSLQAHTIRSTTI
jgi:hypothetical protein